MQATTPSLVQTAFFVTDGVRIVRRYWDESYAKNFAAAYNSVLPPDFIPVTVEAAELIPLCPTLRRLAGESDRSETHTPQ
jgi:hypothetical protein